jgi:hypothetical protein
MKCVTSLFKHYQDAERAMNDLYSLGFERGTISMVARRESMQEDVAAGADHPVTEGTTSGEGVAHTGGILVAPRTLTVPGIGSVITAGTLITTLDTPTRGLAVGAAVSNGLTGVLIGAGIPEPQAQHYTEEIRQGAILVAVEASDERAHEAINILHQTHGLAIQL